MLKPHMLLCCLFMKITVVFQLNHIIMYTIICYIIIGLNAVKAKNYFFVPEMSAYAKMLCESGLPGTQNPLLCPDPPNPRLRSPIFREPESHFRATSPSSQLFISRPFLELTQLQPAIPLRHIQTHNKMSRHQMPFWSDLGMSDTTLPTVRKDMKKIYLIPWSSKSDPRVKSIIDFLLVPEDILQADAPLDVLKSDVYDIDDSDDHHMEHMFERKRRRKHQRKRIRTRRPKNYVTTEDEKYQYRYVNKHAYNSDDDPYETS